MSVYLRATLVALGLTFFASALGGCTAITYDASTAPRDSIWRYGPAQRSLENAGVAVYGPRGYYYPPPRTRAHIGGVLAPPLMHALPGVFDPEVIVRPGPTRRCSETARHGYNLGHGGYYGGGWPRRTFDYRKECSRHF